MIGWVAALLCGWGLALIALPAHRPRRFPEDLHDTGHHPDRRRRRSPATALRDDRRHPQRSLRVVEGDRPSWDLATSCDLLAVAATSGCTVAESVAAVGSVGRGPVAVALRRAAGDIAAGERLADALTAVVQSLGTPLRPLVTTLLSASSSGAAIGPAMLRLADAERRRQRRRVEERVRRLPVLLLLPLVGCILPAFVVLTLIPAGISATRGVELPAPRIERQPVRDTTVPPSRFPPSPTPGG